MIEVKNLDKSYGKLHVLKGVSLNVQKGEKIAIIGPSGSGKSTFLRCLNLLETPDSGTINFEGTDITAKGTDINKIRQKMNMVFQHFNLFPHLTVLQNITLAPLTLKIQADILSAHCLLCKTSTSQELLSLTHFHYSRVILPFFQYNFP